MAALISKYVTRILCDNDGCLEFRSLKEQLSQLFTANDQILRSALFDGDKVSIRRGSEEASASVSAGQILGPDTLLVAKSSLRVCQKRAGECGGCQTLHLSKFYVLGSCVYRDNCKNPHDVAAWPNNAAVLKKHCLDDLSDKQLFQLLLQNDPYLLPKVCSHYNKGEHGSCKFSTKCKNLHICLHYLQGDCRYGSSCKRAHSFDGQSVEILKGLSPENVRILLKSYQNNFIISDHQAQLPFVLSAPPAVRSQTYPSSKTSTRSPTSSAAAGEAAGEAEKKEICLFFFLNKCDYNEKCFYVHHHLPYRWQVKDSVTWKDLPNMEDIEEAYCDPTCDTSLSRQPSASTRLLERLTLKSESVDFLTMSYGASQVRRLSTASSVSKPSFVLTTRWRWYWKDDSGTWIEFGQDDDDKSGGSSSEILEKIYLTEKETKFEFKIKKQRYVLYLKDPAGSQQMFQQNLKYGTKHEVRRRPHFVSAQDLAAQLKRQ